MRVSSSGGWMSAMRPHGKRERSRSSRSGISCGYLSAVRTICLCDSRSALNVWKNSSCVLSLPARNWMSSIEQHVAALAVLATELVDLPVADAVDVLVHERLGLEVEDAPLRVLLADADDRWRAEVGLAEADATIDEERVVLVGRDLGDRARRGVRELVRRADDVRVEGVLGEQVGRRLIASRFGCRPGPTWCRSHVVGATRHRRRITQRLRLAHLEQDLEVLVRLRAQRIEHDRLIVVLEPLLDPLGRRAQGDARAVDCLALDRAQPHLEVVRLDPPFEGAERAFPQPCHLVRFLWLLVFGHENTHRPIHNVDKSSARNLGSIRLASGYAGIACVLSRRCPQCSALFGPHWFPLQREAFRSFINRVLLRQGEKTERPDLRRDRSEKTVTSRWRKSEGSVPRSDRSEKS